MNNINKQLATAATILVASFLINAQNSLGQSCPGCFGYPTPSRPVSRTAVFPFQQHLQPQPALSGHNADSWWARATPVPQLHETQSPFLATPPVMTSQPVMTGQPVMIGTPVIIGQPVTTDQPAVHVQPLAKGYPLVLPQSEFAALPAASSMQNYYPQLPDQQVRNTINLTPSFPPTAIPSTIVGSIINPTMILPSADTIAPYDSNALPPLNPNSTTDNQVISESATAVETPDENITGEIVVPGDAPSPPTTGAANPSDGLQLSSVIDNSTLEPANENFAPLRQTDATEDGKADLEATTAQLAQAKEQIRTMQERATASERTSQMLKEKLAELRASSETKMAKLHAKFAKLQKQLQAGNAQQLKRAEMSRALTIEKSSGENESPRQLDEVVEDVRLKKLKDSLARQIKKANQIHQRELGKMLRKLHDDGGDSVIEAVEAAKKNADIALKSRIESIKKRVQKRIERLNDQ